MAERQPHNPVAAKRKLAAARDTWDLLGAPERKGAVVLLVLMFVGVFLETLGVGLVIPALALFSKTNIGATYPSLKPILEILGNPSQETVASGGMLCLVAVFLLKNLFLALLAWQQQRFTFSTMEKLSERIFALYLSQPYAFHLLRNSAELIRNATDEVAIFTSNVIASLIQLIAELLIIVGIFVLVVSIEPIAVVVVGTAVGALALLYDRLMKGHVARWGGLRQHHSVQMLKHVQQGLGAVKDIKLLGREKEFIREYQFHNRRYAEIGALHNTVLQLPRLGLELFAVASMAALVFSMLSQGRSLESIVPSLGLFAAAAFRVLPSINRVVGATQALNFGLPVVRTLRSELDLPAPLALGDTSVRIPFQRAIVLDQVSYCYPGAARRSLDEVSLFIRRGECVGFVGPSGAGKSTLVDVMLGLLAPDSGELRVDDRNVQDILRPWQNQIGYVPQVIFLTDDSVRRNIAFGIPDEKIDDAAVRRALRAAQLEEFVYGLPNVLDSVVGERGVRLSGGQRQRIGIARALYHDPAILVLDEATSSLDSVTERSVMQAVSELHGRKTIVIVAHRLSTVENCDRLYRLERGRIVNEGTPGDDFAQRG